MTVGRPSRSAECRGRVSDHADPWVPSLRSARAIREVPFGTSGGSNRPHHQPTLERRGTVALPQLTPEQRAAALEKAAIARKVRAELKERLKRGGTDLAQVLKDAENDDILGKMKVSALLEALPKVGKVKAQELMTELEIAPTRRLRGLGDRQRRALLTKFDFEV